ncbi:hypothetical protein LCGC14_0768480 [marine sediment metagenome]|uniref:PABS domain-containing protein n=1 Tax=marine sediment metagenome TaxID=412755 RepID=A0A0F9PZ25_9ZZZZ
MKQKYWPVLDIPEGVEGAYSIKHLHFKVGHKFHTATARTALFGQQSKAVKFDKRVRFHQLVQEDQGVWMTDEPVEQAQANNILEGYYGTVLVGGLGLGYAAANLAANPDVEQVTVVEISSEVIKLVNQHLPDDDGKITVVCADLFEYLKDRTPGTFDMAFYDIWQSDSEDTFFHTVCPLLTLSEDIVEEIPRCWNEDVMRGQLFFGMQQSLMFLSLPPAERKKFMRCRRDGHEYEVTLDDLCTPQDSIWWDWKIEFWRWFRNNDGMSKPRSKNIEDALGHYVTWYGRPEFTYMWPPK